MYAPEDLHSFAISQQYIANTILRQKNQEIQKLKEEIKELKIENNNLKEKDSLVLEIALLKIHNNNLKKRNCFLESVVRQYTQDGVKKQK